jgi:ribokinase
LIETHRLQKVGAAGANQAVAAARLGANVTMIGKVGSDSFGAESIRMLEEFGVNCEHVEVAPGDSSLAVITVSDSGHNTIVVVPGANADVSAEFVESKRDVIRGAGIVLAQLEIPIDSVLRLAAICAAEGVPLMLDPAPARPLPAELLSQCEWITPNATEALFYAAGLDASSTPQQVAAALRTRGARNILLKLGERGAYLDRVAQPALSVAAVTVTAVDTTAAGDTYNGAFAAALVAGRDMADCGQFAAAAAALSVTRAGAQTSITSRLRDGM